MNGPLVTTSPEQDTASVEATPPAPRPLDRFFTAVALAGLVVLLLRVALHAVQPLSNPDTWFHLRIGEQLWGPWSLAHPGSLSRSATATWLPTQWSTEMLMARFEHWFGLPGVAWLSGLWYVSFVVVVYAVCRRRADMLSSTVVTGLVLIGASDALSARPQVISLILLAVTVDRWLVASHDGRPPWVLVPLTWVWATAHGMWSVGVAVGFVAAVGVILDHRGPGHRPWRLLAVPLLSLLAAAVTPVGPRLLATQLAVGNRTSLIGEWAPTSFRTASAFAAALMAGVLLLVWTRVGGVPWVRLLLLLVAVGAAMLSTRMVAVAAVLLAPLLAAGIAGLRPTRHPTRGQLRAERVTLVSACAVLLAAMAAIAPYTATRPADVPAHLSQRLAALPAGTPVLVEDPVGSWIEWRFPGLDPTFDGMLDAYRLPYLERFAAAHDVRSGWRSFVAGSHADVAVLVSGSALSDAVQHRLGWHEVQRDGAWVYLVAPGAGNH